MNQSNNLSLLRINKKPSASQKGVAIMMAVFFLALMSFLVFEISKETLYISIISSQDVHELKAYYAAKAGLDISLLRIKAYQQIKDQIEQAGEVAKPFAQKADIIWQFPFVWPPVLPEEAGMVAQSQMQTVLKETFLKKVQYAPVIEDMGSLIDINQLDSPSKAVADATKQQILEIFRKILRDDEEFSDKYVIDEIELVIDNIKDWMDADTDSVNGGSEAAVYADRGERNFPPNQHFKTIEELLLVDKMTSDIYEILKNSVTVLGNPSINVNQADRNILMSLDPNMTDEIINEIIRRREDPDHGPFNETLFKAVIEDMYGSYESFNPQKIPLSYSALANFRIESTGSSGRINKTILAYVFDQNALLDELVKAYSAQDQENGLSTGPEGTGSGNNPPSGQGQQPQQNQTAKTTKRRAQGPPPVVFMKVY